MSRTLTDADLAVFADSIAADMAALDVAEPVRPTRRLPPLTDVPVMGGVQAQGDVLILPIDRAMPHWAQPLPHDRAIPIVTTGNGHALRALTRGTGRVDWAPIHDDGHVIAVVHIAGDAVLLLEQPGGGHTPLAVGAGCYEIRRQREAAPWAPAEHRDPWQDPSGRTLGAAGALFVAAASVVVVD